MTAYQTPLFQLIAVPQYWNLPGKYSLVWGCTSSKRLGSSCLWQKKPGGQKNSFLQKLEIALESLSCECHYLEKKGFCWRCLGANLILIKYCCSLKWHNLARDQRGGKEAQKKRRKKRKKTWKGNKQKKFYYLLSISSVHRLACSPVSKCRGCK